MTLQCRHNGYKRARRRERTKVLLLFALQLFAATSFVGGLRGVFEPPDWIMLPLDWALGGLVGYTASKRWMSLR